MSNDVYKVELPYRLPRYLSESDEDDKCNGTIIKVKTENRRLRVLSSSSDDQDFVPKANKPSRLRPKSKRIAKVEQKELWGKLKDNDSSSDVEFISYEKNEILIDSKSTICLEEDDFKDNKKNQNIVKDCLPRISIGVYNPVREDCSGVLQKSEVESDITLQDITMTADDTLNATIEICDSERDEQVTLSNCQLSPIVHNLLTVSNSIGTSSPYTTSTSKPDLEDDDPMPLKVMLKIMKFVIEHDRLKKLLNDHETIMLNNFLRLARKEYIFFCLKLYTRIKKWYNIFELRTAIKQQLSDPEVMEMYYNLAKTGFVDTDYSSEPIHGLLLQLPVKNLKELCVEFKIPFAKLNKADLVDRLFNNCNQQSTLTIKSSIKSLLMESIKKKLGFCFKLNDDFFKILNKVHLLYSFTTNEFLTTSDLYLFMSGIIDRTITMPVYTIDRNVEIFSSVEEFNSFQEAFQCYISVLIAIDKKDVALTYQLCSKGYEQLKQIVERNVVDNRPSHLRRFTAGHKYTKAIWTAIPSITKHHKEAVSEWLVFLLKQRLYCQSLRGLWFNQLIMIQYTHLKKHKEATKTLIAALKDKNLKKIHRMDINKRAEKIKHSKAHRISQIEFGEISSVQPIPIKDLPYREIDSQAFRSEVSGQKRNYYKKVDGGVEIYTVEEVALNYYKERFNFTGMHCEGSLLVTLFFVLFWDIIYDETIPSVFISEIQYFPLDLYCKEFYANRKKRIDNRLLEIDHYWTDAFLETFICNVWDENWHRKSLIAPSLVDSPQCLSDMILCIGRSSLRKIIERFLEDFRGNRSGLPDLFLWNIEEKKCKFVEVKGENDHLSAKQECWLDFLRSIGVDVEVCHVHTMGSKRKRHGAGKSANKTKELKEKQSKSLLDMSDCEN